MITLKVTPAQAAIMLHGLEGASPTRSGRLLSVVNKGVALGRPLIVSGRPSGGKKGAYAYGYDSEKLDRVGFFRRRELEQLYRWLLLAHRSAAGSIKGQLKKNVNKASDLLKIDAVQRLADILAADAWLKGAKKKRTERPAKGRGGLPPARQSCSRHCLPALGSHSASCRARRVRASSS